MPIKRIATTLARTLPSRTIQPCRAPSLRIQCLREPTSSTTTPASRSFTTSILPQQATTLSPPGFRPNTYTRTRIPPIRKRRPFTVNDNPAVLNAMYTKLLGAGGDVGLSDNIKWQCVTHKTFDHGMQAYNEKLAFYGRRIAYLHTTLYFLRTALPTYSTALGTPPLHKSGDVGKGLNNINYSNVKETLSAQNLFAIARSCGLIECLRWKPADDENLARSGVEAVAVDSLLAIVGAVGMQRGGDAARRMMEDRILVGLDVVLQRGSR